MDGKNSRQGEHGSGHNYGDRGFRKPYFVPYEWHQSRYTNLNTLFPDFTNFYQLPAFSPTNVAKPSSADSRHRPPSQNGSVRHTSNVTEVQRPGRQPKPDQPQGCAERVAGFFTKIFQSFGRRIGNNPWKLIIISTLLTAGLGCGMIRLTSETDTETLYTPINSQASKDRTKTNRLFPDTSGSNFNSYSLSVSDRYADIIISASNVLSNQTLDEIESIIQKIKNISITLNGVEYTYSDICAIQNSSCFVSGENVLPAIKYAYGVQKNLTYPELGLIKLKDYLGNIKHSSGKVDSAEYYRITFHLRQDNATYIETAKAWEAKFIDEVTKIKTSNVGIYYSTSQSLNDELNQNTGGDIKFFSITFTLMITYATIVAGGDAVSSRTWASWAGVMAAGFGIISAFGLISACGLKFVQIVGVMPFLIIGIGVDDMFLLMSSWVQTYPARPKENEKRPSDDPSALPVHERMAKTFGTAGIGITITSLTDLLAFVIGASSVFVSVRNFCVYTGVAVIFCYLYQCLFFSPCLSLHGQRVKSKRHCMTCVKVGDRPSNKCRALFCWGSEPKYRDDDERLLEKLPRKVLPKLLLNVWGKVIVIILFLGYLGVSIWGVTKFKQGLDLKNLVSKDSYYYTYSEVSNSHYDISIPVPFIFENSVNYIKQDQIDDITSLLKNAKDDTDVDPDSEICWLFSYMKYPFYENDTQQNFRDGLKKFLIQQPRFETDVVFDSSDSNVEASRCYLFSNNLKDSNAQADLMLRMRKLADESPLPVYVYHPAFIFFEQYVAILSSTLQTVGVAVAVMFVVTCIFMPKPLMVILVVLNILSILVGIFGFLYFWDLSLSSITMIHLIMSVGFSVDFSVHVCSAYFMEEPSDNEEDKKLTVRERKTKTAIVHAAGPILNGAISSFLGIIVLVFSQSYIFNSFFKIMFTVILFGMLHAVFLLPVVLSICGPVGSKRRHTSQVDVQNTNSLPMTQPNSRPETPPPDYPL